jgi:hypothetical protein
MESCLICLVGAGDPINSPARRLQPAWENGRGIVSCRIRHPGAGLSRLAEGSPEAVPYVFWEP